MGLVNKGFDIRLVRKGAEPQDLLSACAAPDPTVIYLNTMFLEHIEDPEVLKVGANPMS